jgi:thiamine kinase-like enzyme
MLSVLHEIIRRVPDWTHAQAISIDLLPGGMTNQNYRITVDSQPFVLRVSGPNTPLLGINRRNECAITRAAGLIGIAPEVVYCSEPEGHLVTRFICGHKLSRADLQRPELSAHLAQILKQIHALPPVDATFSPFRSIESYHTAAARLGSTFPANFDWFIAQMYTIEQAERAHPIPDSLCHNDLVRGNLVNDTTITVLDWEYAGMGNFFFDLATVILDNRFSADQERWFLECYFGTIHPDYGEHLGRMKCIWLLREAVWGLLQAQISDIAFDFQGYAAARFARLAHYLTTGTDTEVTIQH